MKRYTLFLVWLSLFAGAAHASHPLPPPLALCTDGELIVSVVFVDGRHEGVAPFLQGRVVLIGGDFIEVIARVDGLTRIDGGPNVIWRGDGFHLRVDTRGAGDTPLIPATFNGRDDDGRRISTGDLLCRLLFP